MLEAFEPGLVLELLGTYRGNAMLGVPTMLVALLEHPAFPTTDLSSVKAICSGGSTVPATLVRKLEEKLGAPFTIVFGQTERLPGRGADRLHRQRRGQGQHDRPAAA